MKYLILLLLVCLVGCATTERIPVFKEPNWNDYVYIEFPTKTPDVHFVNVVIYYKDPGEDNLVKRSIAFVTQEHLKYNKKMNIR